MKREEADQVIKEAEAFIGIRKPVVTQSQLGLPSTIRECKFDGIEVREEKGEFFKWEIDPDLYAGIACPGLG